ncbi:MAG TPA: hypothetical protein VLF09_06400 [Cellvibrio sp.]|nr:hypothetical protein [Cellvibrio sp.]
MTRSWYYLLLKLSFVPAFAGRLCYCRWFDGATLSQLPGIGQLRRKYWGLKNKENASLVNWRFNVEGILKQQG